MRYVVQSSSHAGQQAVVEAAETVYEVFNYANGDFAVDGVFTGTAIEQLAQRGDTLQIDKSDQIDIQSFETSAGGESDNTGLLALGALAAFVAFR